jgi:pSer/pThr/pTyr-binding forkhead associated (FHA) protein
MLLLEVTQGLAAGRTFELTSEVGGIGRAPSNELVLEDMHVSGEHARVTMLDGRVVLQDLRSTNGTTLVRRGERRRLAGEQSSIEIETGDVIELGSGDGVTSMRVTVADEADVARVVSMRRLDEIEPAAAIVERDPGALSALYAAQKRIGSGNDLDQVLIEVADAVLGLVPNATHVTIVLRDDDQSDGGSSAAFVPVMTRVRVASGSSGPPSGAVPITRAVYRRVVRERAAVLAADASAPPSRSGAPRSAAPSASRSGAARRSSASSRSTTATRPECSTARTSSSSSCSPPTPRSPSPTRG